MDVFRISLGAENVESKASRKLSLRGSCWNLWAPDASSSVPPAQQEAGWWYLCFLLNPSNEKGLDKRVNEKPSEPSITEDERRGHMTDQIWLTVGFTCYLLSHLIPMFTGVGRNCTSLCHQWELKSTWGNRFGEWSLTQGACAISTCGFLRTERQTFPVVVLDSTELQTYTQGGPFSMQHESFARFLCSLVSRFNFPFLCLSSYGWIMGHLLYVNNIRAYDYGFSVCNPFRQFAEHERLLCKATYYFHKENRRGCQAGSLAPLPLKIALRSWVMKWSPE